MITYNTQLLGDTDALKKLLQKEQLVYNIASKEQFTEKTNSLVILHSKVYYNVRKSNPEIPSQVIIKAEQEVLAGYRSIKSNRHKKNKPIVKSNLSMRLDKRLYSLPDKFSIRITTMDKRQEYKFVIYPRLKELLEKYPFQDPLIYEDSGNIYICLSFENKQPKLKERVAMGVDLGIRRSAATSDGRLIIDKKFNGEKRKLRHLKDILKSKSTKSARRKLRYKLKRKERNKNKNQTHLIANLILNNTEADTICLENLKSIKRKKNPYQNKHSISQVPLYELRRVITYKATNMGKNIVLVCPSYTSQRDNVSGKIEGERRGCRFYSNNGLIYDADINAAINIAKISKLPVSQTTRLTYGQVSVNRPNVCKSLASVRVLQAPTL